MTDPRPLAGAARAHPWPPSDDAELAAALRDVGAWIDYPTAADLAEGVRARIHGRVPPPPAWRRASAWLARAASGSAPGARAGSDARRRRAGRAAVAGLAVLAVLAAAVATPGVRDAVADRLGLRGVAIRHGGLPDGGTPAAGAGGDPGTGVTPVAALLDLGRRLTLDEARAAVGWPLVRPDPAAWGEPDEVYLDARTPGGRVALVFAAGPALPALGATGVGAVLTQFEGQPSTAAIGKGIGPGTSITSVRVAGEDGYWIEGDPHPFVDLVDSNGRWRRDRARLAGNTLLWTQGDLTLRLESALDRAAALRLAESIR